MHGGSAGSGRPITHGLRSKRAKPALRRQLLEDLANALEAPLLRMPQQVAAILDRHVAAESDPSEDLIRLGSRLSFEVARLTAAWIARHPTCLEVFSPGPLNSSLWQLAVVEAAAQAQRDTSPAEAAQRDTSPAALDGN